MSNIVRVVKSRRLRWEGHVTRMEENFQNFNRKETFRKAYEYMEEQLEWILKTLV